MIIRSIHIKEGMFYRKINFTPKVNLVHSLKNSTGKTTLLRLILYSLGYNIPNTRKIKFERCEVESVIDTETSGAIILLRTAADYIVATINGNRNTFVLPEQQHQLHALIFGTDNKDILDNLLGAFYLDQEKGWTLLNRGVVIGSIRFNIEALIRGLSGRDCTDLLNMEIRLLRELEKYRQISSVAKYQEKIEKESDYIAIDPYSEKLENELEQLSMEKKLIKKELRRLDHAISDNKNFKKFISEMKLLVKTSEGKTIPVTSENIVGYNDNIDYLMTKHKLVSAKLSAVLDNIKEIELHHEKEAQQLAFWESESFTETFDRNISKISINPVSVIREINRLENKLTNIRTSISNRTRVNNNIVSEMHEAVVKYAVELGIGNDGTMAPSYLFTSNLKELTGAVLHKTVFAFRLAYILMIEGVLRIKLPIILDSPRGKEIDKENAQLMMNILKRDFSDNQIIIASIFEYDFDEVNRIEINNQLLEMY
jgi:hypothetical protein